MMKGKNYNQENFTWRGYFQIYRYLSAEGSAE